jgi:predicted porin
MIARRLAAVALLAATTPALAQQPAAAEPPKLPFTVYGTLNVNLALSEASGATNSAAKVKSRTSVSVDSSNLGLRGSADIRDWFQIVFQCETSASVDGISASGICNRNSRLGISNATFGTIFYGNWDTPYKAMAYGSKADDPFMNTDVYGFGAILSSPGFNYRSSGWSTSSSSTVAGFDIRASNSVGYHSPRWSGVSFKLQYAADEFKNASGTQDPRLYSGVLNYDNGPLSLAAAFERHEDGFALAAINTATAPAFGATAVNGTGSAAASAHSTDSAWRVAAGWAQAWGGGETTLAAMVEGLTLEQSDPGAGAVHRYQRVAWHVAGKHRAGDHEIRARYSMAAKGSCSLDGGGSCSTTGYGASEIAVGYAYHLTKTAQAYAYFVRIQNEKNAQYTFPIGGSPAVAGSTPAGADPQAFGLGLRYSF